jgi:general secretion pathway protein C
MSRAAREGDGRPAWVSRGTFAAEAVAASLLAFLLAQLVWAGYPPLVETSSLVAPVASDFSAPRAAVGLNPFRRGDAAATAAADPLADAPETALNLILVGVRASRGEAPDRGGAAIIQTPDNQQRLYGVGDAIVVGVTLAAVEPDRVVIDREGLLESVAFERRASLIGRGGVAAEIPVSAAPVVPAAPVLAGSDGPVSAAALIADVTPFSRAAGGVVVAPRGDGVAFAAAGLQAFDVVLSVNGVALDGIESWATAVAGLGPGATVVAELQRAGTPVAIHFVLE